MGYLQDLGREREGKITKIQRIGIDPVKVFCSRELFGTFDHDSYWLNAFQEYHEGLYNNVYDLRYLRFTPYEIPSDDIITGLFRYVFPLGRKVPVEELKKNTKERGIYRVFVLSHGWHPARKFYVINNEKTVNFDREIWMLGGLRDDEDLFNAEVNGFLDIIRGKKTPEEGIKHVRESFIYPRLLYEI